MGQPIELTDDNFDNEVIKSDLPVLIDFWAVWCGPCKVIAPIVEEIDSEYSGKLKVGKMDVDKHRQVAIKYGIRSIPTLLIFKEGKLVHQIVGNTSKAKILERLESVL